MNPPPIYVISGTPGAGKTSVATALMQRFPKGLHIPLDDLREWVVSGIAFPIPEWTPETTVQFRLARRAAAQTARIYAEAGFAVALDDVIFPEETEKLFVEPLAPFPVHKVLLRDDTHVALARNATRTNKAFDTSVLAHTIRDLSRHMDPNFFAKKGWLVINNTDLTIEQTVDMVFEQTLNPVADPMS
jgi:chloramphenicol 3-O-phosphotransferase